jgi:hypothetical protein
MALPHTSCRRAFALGYGAGLSGVLCSQLYFLILLRPNGKQVLPRSVHFLLNTTTPFLVPQRFQKGGCSPVNFKMSLKFITCGRFTRNNSIVARPIGEMPSILKKSGLH